jgi:hypothetical protein
MNRIVWSKKRAIITLALCATLAVSAIMLLQMNQTTQAALIGPLPGRRVVCFLGVSPAFLGGVPQGLW